MADWATIQPSRRIGPQSRKRVSMGKLGQGGRRLVWGIPLKFARHHLELTGLPLIMYANVPFSRVFQCVHHP